MPDNPNDALYQAFQRSMAGYDVGMGGRPPQAPPFPFLNPNTTAGRLGTLVAAPLAESLRQHPDINSLLLTMGRTNAMDAYQAREYQLGQMRIMQQFQDLDRIQARDLTRGLWIAGGADYEVRDGRRYLSGHGQEAALDRWSGDVMAPMVRALATVKPEWADSMMMGSRMVAASQIYEGARYIPTRGSGISGQVDPFLLSRGLTNELFGEGSRMDTRSTYGMLGASTGQAFTELTKRGLISVDADSQNPEQVGKNVAGQLKNYLGAIAAVKEVFGDMGNPNAPMREIINGLQKLTEGGAGVYDGGSLRQMVMEIQTIAKETPLGYEGVFAAQERANAIGYKLGLGEHSRYVTGPHSHAGLRAAQYRAAYMATGMRPSYESMDPQQFSDYSEYLRSGGAVSGLGNLLGAVFNAGESVDETSQLGRLVQAMSRGETTAMIDGNEVDISTMGVADFEKVAQASGLRAGSITRGLQARAANATALAKNQRVSAILTRGQQHELSGLIEASLSSMDPELVRAAGGMDAIISGLFNNAGRADSVSGLGKIIAGAAGMQGDQRANFTNQLKEALDGPGLSQRFKDMGLPGDAFNALKALSPEAIKAGEGAGKDIAFRAAMRELLNNKNPGDIMTNVSKLLMNMNKESFGVTLPNAVKTIFGAIPNDEWEAGVRALKDDERWNEMDWVDDKGKPIVGASPNFQVWKDKLYASQEAKQKEGMKGLLDAAKGFFGGMGGGGQAEEGWFSSLVHKSIKEANNVDKAVAIKSPNGGPIEVKLAGPVEIKMEGKGGVSGRGVMTTPPTN